MLSPRARPVVIAVAVPLVVMAWLLLKNRGTVSRPPDQDHDAEVTWHELKPPQMKGELRERIVEPHEPKRVTFWGRVVDQNNAPVKEAIVKMSASGGFRNSTDENGFFHVEGLDATPLSIMGIAKPGYYLPPLFTALDLHFSETLKQGLDRTNPVVFRLLRKEGEYEGLLRVERKFLIESVGKPVTIDLLTGQMSDAPDAKGDFRVTFDRPASVEEKFTNYNWSATIEAVDGGFAPLSTNTNNTWWAPKDGYTPRLQWAFRESDPKWEASALTKTFFRSRNGQVHGVLKSLALGPTFNAVLNGCPVVALTGVLNPNRSRNLQNGDAAVLNVFETLDAVSHFNPRKATGMAEGAREAETAAKLPKVHTVPEPRMDVPSPPSHDFYGKVLDEKGDPVGAAAVEITVQPPFQRRAPDVFNAESDDKGIVKIAALPLGTWPVRGPDKAGYLGDPASHHFISFGIPGSGDRGISLAHAEVWRLWKTKGPPQPVVNELIAVECPSDGTPVQVDLLMKAPWAGIPVWRPTIPAGKAVDLKLSVTRSPDDKFTVTKPWRFSVEAPSGGIAETDDSLAYLAPESGYKPSLEVTGQQTWSVEKRLFLKARDGKLYGSLFLEVSAIGHAAGSANPPGGKQLDPPGEIQIRCVLNPTGSRSLEPDPKRTYKAYDEYLKAQQQQK